jgi:hypothetical protein
MKKDHYRINKKVEGSKKAFIFGPFIGELYWEAYRFAPYCISLKKRFRYHHIVVFTRPEHFDLYGQYADILVPLKIKEGMYFAEKFKLKAYPLSEYKALCSYIKRTYQTLFDIEDHFFPRIDGFMWKVKWQLPRSYMNYDFRPRKGNIKAVEEVYGKFEKIVLTTEPDVELENYHVIKMDDFFKDMDLYFGRHVTWLGCLIELIKRCEFSITNCEDNLGKFSLLLNKPVIAVNEKLSDDTIHLMNPHDTIVIKCKDYKEGVVAHENNF